MSPYRQIQLLSGAVHHAELQNPDLEYRQYYLMHLWSTHGVPKDMKDNAIKWKNRYKYGGNNETSN